MKAFTKVLAIYKWIIAAAILFLSEHVVFNQEMLVFHHTFLMGNDKSISITIPSDTILVPPFHFDINTVTLQIANGYTFDSYPPNDSIYAQESINGQVKSLIWNVPPIGALINQRFNVKFETKVLDGIDTITYPISIPDKYKSFINPDGFSQSDDPKIIELGNRLKGNQNSLIEIIGNVFTWLSDSIIADFPITPEGVVYGDALNTLKYKKGICGNYSNLAIAILRSIGIPCLQQGGTTGDFCLVGHQWINIYIPYFEFVGFEPQVGKEEPQWDTRYIAYQPGGFVGIGDHFNEILVLEKNGISPISDLQHYNQAINCLFDNQITCFIDTITLLINNTSDNILKGYSLSTLADYYSSIDSLEMALQYYTESEKCLQYNYSALSSIEAIEAINKFLEINVETFNISNVESNSAQTGGRLNIASDILSKCGVCWSTNSNPTINDFKTEDEIALNSFTSSISGISPNTTYNLRAYITNIYGTTLYGNKVTFKTTKIQQNITFDSIPVKRYGDDDFVLEAVSDALLPISFISDNDSVIIITDNRVHIVGTGNCFITAIQDGNDIYNKALRKVQSMAVNKANLVVSADNKTKNYGDLNPVLTFSYDGFIWNETDSVIDTKPIAGCLAENSSLPGQYPITVSGGFDNNYNFTYLEGILTILNPTNIGANYLESMHIYPNPTSDYLYISYFLPRNEDVVLQLFDSRGGVVLIRSITNTFNELIANIDISNLQNGIYILRIQTRFGILFKKIIKN